MDTGVNSDKNVKSDKNMKSDKNVNLDINANSDMNLEIYKKIIPFINCENELAINSISEAVQYETAGADEIFIYNYETDEKSRHEFLSMAKELIKQVDIPVYIGVYVKRFEDIKKAFYTGASYVVVRLAEVEDYEVIKEGAARFGKDKIIAELKNYKDITDEKLLSSLKELGIASLFLEQVEISGNLPDAIEVSPLPVLLKDSLSENDMSDLLEMKNVGGISTDHFKGKDLHKVKLSLKEKNIKVNTFESNISFEEFKLNNDGLIPVVVQDYKTSQVLMVAYMNEEAFIKTVETGKMTYYSRSRKALWVKGETSGHFQYVKELCLDCDKDTILAKVRQIGPACHTGSQSCFFNTLVKKEYDDTNPLAVFQDVYNVILDRKKNPKEGSYTNYLFDKGIDKILKKCGEEATEIVIAAKNPDAEELKYEISDFLYHMMVLMAECNVDWQDIVKELAHRR